MSSCLIILLLLQLGSSSRNILLCKFLCGRLYQIMGLCQDGREKYRQPFSHHCKPSSRSFDRPCSLSRPDSCSSITIRRCVCTEVVFKVKCDSSPFCDVLTQAILFFLLCFFRVETSTNKTPVLQARQLDLQEDGCAVDIASFQSGEPNLFLIDSVLPNDSNST